MKIRLILGSLYFVHTLGHALELQQSGRIGLESRYFTEHAEMQNSVLAEPELYWNSDSDTDSITLTLFGRIDSMDDERSHADIREAFWLHVGDGWETRMGIGKVFWGVTESTHLVDIINQTDAVESIDGEQKLGQALVQYTRIQNWGVVDFFLLPYFRERTFPGPDGYLRGQYLIDTDNAAYESDQAQRHWDYALRYSHYVGPIDIGLSWFKGTNRDPRLLPRVSSEGLVLVPYYDQIQQLGLDLQATLGDWLWKLEVIGRDDSSQDFSAFTAGFEYTLVGIFGSAVDMGLLSEYSRDSRQEQAPNPFQNDVFVGSRFTFNDVQSSELLLGIARDSDDSSSYLAFVEGNRRIGNSWKVTVDARFFGGDRGGDLLSQIKDDDYASLTLERFW